MTFAWFRICREYHEWLQHGSFIPARTKKQVPRRLKPSRDDKKKGAHVVGMTEVMP
jgi:hypothetical protein